MVTAGGRFRSVSREISRSIKLGVCAAVPDFSSPLICAAMNEDRPPICPYCRKPMKLFRTISKAISPLFVFHCSPCNHTTTKQQKPSSEIIRGLKLKDRHNRAYRAA